MLDIHTAKSVKSAIDKHFCKEIITLESVCRMQPIPVDTNSAGYTILATQYGDMTILVWVQFDPAFGVSVRAVKAQGW